jgi:hypothetical protein
MPMIFLIISATTLKQQNMKRSRFYLIATLLLGLCANAQITKGNWMMGGNAGFSSGKTIVNGISSEITNALFINPNIGYFFIDKLAVGTKSRLTFYNISTNYDLGPFVRYYFLEKEKPINIFSEVNYRIQKNSQNDDFKAENFNIKAGGVYFLNSSVGLELALNYASQKTNQDSEIRNVFLEVGFQIHLEREK